MKVGNILAVMLGAAVLSGCMSTEDDRLEGVSFDAGDAVAHNSALQIIDPWPPGVQDTNLLVPAERTEKSTDPTADSTATLATDNAG